MNKQHVVNSILAGKVLCTCAQDCFLCECPHHHITYKAYLKQFTKKQLIEIIIETLAKK